MGRDRSIDEGLNQMSSHILYIWITGIVGGVFVLLSAIHVYWAIGGSWGSQAAVPSINISSLSGDEWIKTINPRKGITLLVATGLALIAGLIVLRAGLFGAPIEHWTLKSIIGLLAILMIARAIGDFHLVGFFKTIKGSLFARLDTQFYSPLCVALGVGLGKIALG
jgi:uncharacterized membrane protein YdcZ (DUF606 family)